MQPLRRMLHACSSRAHAPCGERGRQRAQHVAQAARLAPGRHLGGNKHQRARRDCRAHVASADDSAGVARGRCVLMLLAAGALAGHVGRDGHVRVHNLHAALARLQLRLLELQRVWGASPLLQAHARRPP